METLFSVIFFLLINHHLPDGDKTITLDKAVDTLALDSYAAEIEKINYQSDLLQYDIYKKSLLPSLSLELNPVNFNRSLRLLQQPSDGSYTYVDDYSNNSSAGISIRQKIGLTGGEINVGSSLNYLNEFSTSQNKFNTSPFYIGYSQKLFGGGKLHRKEKNIEEAKNNVAIKQYCTKLSQIQQQALGHYMTALLDKMQQDLSKQTLQNNDTLMNIASIKLANGHITEFDMKQIELQSLNALYTYENACKEYIDSRNKLSVFLGLDDDLEVIMPTFNVPIAIDISTVLFYVNQNNPFVQQQEIQQMESERNLISNKINNRFNGNISLNYGVNQYANNFAAAYKNGNIRQSFVVGFQIPIFQWGANRKRIQIAENNHKAVNLNIENRKLEFENEIKEKVNNYNHSVRLWLTAEKAYKLSQEQYQMLIQKFSLGKVSVYELTTAQEEQNNAMRRYYSSIRDTYNSYFTIRTMSLYDFKNDKELQYIYIND